MKKTIEIRTAAVEIKVVKVDGHKMTKATFRQVRNIAAYIGDSSEIDSQMVLGWVFDDNDHWFLIEKDGVLGKCRVKKGFHSYLGRCPVDQDHLDFVRSNFAQLFIAT